MILGGSHERRWHHHQQGDHASLRPNNTPIQIHTLLVDLLRSKTHLQTTVALMFKAMVLHSADQMTPIGRAPGCKLQVLRTSTTHSPPRVPTAEHLCPDNLPRITVLTSSNPSENQHMAHQPCNRRNWADQANQARTIAFRLAIQPQIITTSPKRRSTSKQAATALKYRKV